jgi:inner membrane protein
METMVVTWWMWLLLGLILLVAEILTPGGFFVIFFGFGALAVGVLSLFGMSLPLTFEVLIFILLSGASLLLFRKPMLERFKLDTPKKDIDSLVGEFAVAVAEIPAGGFGKAELRGTNWSARNVGEGPIAAASRIRVEKVDGLTLWVRG